MCNAQGPHLVCSHLRVHAVIVVHRYTFGFDSGRQFVSVRPETLPSVAGLHAGCVPIKEDKIDEFKWNQRPLLAIEDPFETNYNVSHVLRDGTYKRMRSEFAVRHCGIAHLGTVSLTYRVRPQRAYAILSSTKAPALSPEALINVLCDPIPEDERPKRRPRANTTATEEGEGAK